MKDNYIAAMHSVRMPEDCRERIQAALENQGTYARPRRRWTRTGLVLAAAACLMVGSAMAAAWRTGVLTAFFQGNTTVLEPYVQTAVDSASDGNYQLSVDSYLFDGEGAYLVITVKGLTQQAIEDLKSNRVIAQTHLDFWGQNMVDHLMESGGSGPDTFHVSEMWGQSVRELPAPDADSRSWRIKADTPREGLSGQPLELWVDFMGKDHAVLLPVDTAAPSATLFPDVALTAQDGTTMSLKELTLKATGFSYVVSYPEKADDPFRNIELQLKLEDGIILTQEQLGTEFHHGGMEGDSGYCYQINDVFASPVDISQVEAVIVNGVELAISRE